MLWCMRRRTTDVRCILYPNEIPVEVQVFQDRDVVLTELFQEEWLALNWARAYCERLKLQGWREVRLPDPKSPKNGRSGQPKCGGHSQRQGQVFP